MPIIRIFFPEQRKWMARIFIWSGIPLAAGQLWEPYVNALLARYLEIRIPTEAATNTGWAFIGIGLVVFIFNEIVDRWPKRAMESHADRSDRKSLVSLFSEIHIPAIDTFVEYGKVSMTYIPALHYYAGVEACVSTSNFYLHDAALRAQVNELYASLGKALSFGHFFRDVPNQLLQKFDSRHDIHRDERAKNAHDAFIQSVYETEQNMRALCSTVREKFPDFDFDATNAAALKDYRDTQRAFKL
jgi:hypothetical protein